MAEFLIKAVDASHAVPETDRGCWKLGHPVVVMDDGHVWGTAETLPMFVVLKVPGLDLVTARQSHRPLRWWDWLWCWWRCR